jgi:hypothetical protein
MAKDESTMAIERLTAEIKADAKAKREAEKLAAEQNATRNDKVIQIYDGQAVYASRAQIERKERAKTAKKIVRGVAAIGAGILLFNANAREQFKQTAKNTADRVRASGFLSTKIGKIVKFGVIFGGILAAINILLAPIKLVAKVLGGLTKILFGALKPLVGLLGKGFKKLGGFLSKGFDALKGGVGKLFTGIKDNFGKLIGITLLVLGAFKLFKTETFQTFLAALNVGLSKRTAEFFGVTDAGGFFGTLKNVWFEVWQPALNEEWRNIVQGLKDWWNEPFYGGLDTLRGVWDSFFGKDGSISGWWNEEGTGGLASLTNKFDIIYTDITDYLIPRFKGIGDFIYDEISFVIKSTVQKIQGFIKGIGFNRSAEDTSDTFKTGVSSLFNPFQTPTEKFNRLLNRTYVDELGNERLRSTGEFVGRGREVIAAERPLLSLGDRIALNQPANLSDEATADLLSAIESTPNNTGQIIDFASLENATNKALVFNPVSVNNAPTETTVNNVVNNTVIKKIFDVPVGQLITP